jgi:hypothetical protein
MVNQLGGIDYRCSQIVMYEKIETLPGIRHAFQATAKWTLTPIDNNTATQLIVHQYKHLSHSARMYH